MKKLLIIMAMLAAGLSSPAFGQTARNPAGTVIELHDTACVNPVAISLIKPEHLPKFKASSTTLANQKPIPGCWTLVDGQVVIVDNDGDVYDWPAATFGISSF